MTDRLKGSAPRRALASTLVYAATGAAWIVLSDRLVAALIADPSLRSTVQTGKGWAFIGLTAAVLFIVLWRQAKSDADSLAESRRQQAEIAALSNFRLSVIETPQVWINTVNAAGEITLWNEAAERISGYCRDEVLDHARVWEWLYPDPTYRQWVVSKARSIIEGVEAVQLETCIRTNNGDERELEWYSRQLRDADGQVIGAVAFGIDVTLMRSTQRTLQERERELSALIDNLPGMAYRCLDDETATMTFISRGCAELTGYTDDELTASSHCSFWDLLVDPADRDSYLMQQRIASGQRFSLEYRIRRRDGEVVWVLERGCAVVIDDQPLIEGIILDITERKRMEQQLEWLATRDQLTGLYNRRTMDERLRDELARAQRYNRPVSVLWLDLDNFKRVNDHYGHQVGDEVLRHLTRRLQDAIRDNDLLARYGGEELIVAMPEVGLEGALEAAERIRGIVARDAYDASEGTTIRLTVSIGVAAYPEHGHDMDTLYRAADDAMYQGKQAGRNTVHRIQPTHPGLTVPD